METGTNWPAINQNCLKSLVQKLHFRQLRIRLAPGWVLQLMISSYSIHQKKLKLRPQHPGCFKKTQTETCGETWAVGFMM